ncbi:MAG: hypothetical protein NTW87_14045 [Planctomycetota bacterium]|nr:hypothetical protein [Planctomycetota bacterium]
MKSYALEARVQAAIEKPAAGQVRHRRKPVQRRKGAATPVTVQTKRRALTIHDLGWTKEIARDVRSQLASFAEDWDDPAMDVYNEP